MRSSLPSRHLDTLGKHLSDFFVIPSLTQLTVGLIGVLWKASYTLSRLSISQQSVRT